MKKNIKDYLHLYLGCDCMVKETGESEFKSVLEGIQKDKFLLKEYNHLLLFEAADLKPILRPLSDMTEDEAVYIANFCFTDEVPYAKRIKIGKDFIAYNFLNQPLHAIFSVDVEQFDWKDSFEITRYLLSKHFDLFGLIDAGLAIDKTTIK